MSVRAWILVAGVLVVCPLMLGAQKPQKPPKPGEPANPAIAYGARSNSGYYDLMVMDADARNQVRLVRGGDNMMPSWSPDGEWIAFARSSVAVPGIYMVRTNGTGLCFVAPTNDQFYGAPAWSPGPDADGDYWIIYVDRLEGESHTDLFASRGRCATTDQRRLTDTPDVTENWPAWSADGRLAVNGEGFDIHVFDVVTVPDGFELVHVANLTSAGPLAGLAGNTGVPSWTPAGTELLVSGAGSGGLDLWVVSSSEPGVATQLTFSSDLWEGRTAWSPDGTRIVFENLFGADLYVADVIRIGASWSMGAPVLLLEGSARRSFRTPAWRPVP